MKILKDCWKIVELFEKGDTTKRTVYRKRIRKRAKEILKELDTLIRMHKIIQGNSKMQVFDEEEFIELIKYWAFLKKTLGETRIVEQLVQDLKIILNTGELP